MYLNLTSPFNSNLAKLDGNSNFANLMKCKCALSILSYFCEKYVFQTVKFWFFEKNCLDFAHCTISKNSISVSWELRNNELKSVSDEGKHLPAAQPFFRWSFYLLTFLELGRSIYSARSLVWKELFTYSPFSNLKSSTSYR